MKTLNFIFIIMLLNLSEIFSQNRYVPFPKVELHLHLDCSLSYEVVKQLSPQTSFEEYSNSFIAPAKCTDLADYISRAKKGFELMQTREQLRIVTLDLFKQLSLDNVVYAEIRFAPLQHIYNGLQATEAVDAVNKATEEGKQLYGIEAGVILCTLRHYTEAQSMETVELVNAFKGTNIIGFDIAADEAGYPINNHIKAFKYAKEIGIPCTAHAGEAKGAESVWETLTNLYPTRIGHGVRSAEDPALLAYLKEKNIHLEICPTSNIQTNVFDKIENHSVNKIFHSGVSMSINTDARTISKITLSSEYSLLEKVFHWDKEDFKKCNLEAISHSFTTETIKNKIRKILTDF